jgi:hypothetical protein
MSAGVLSYQARLDGESEWTEMLGYLMSHAAAVGFADKLCAARRPHGSFAEDRIVIVRAPSGHETRWKVRCEHIHRATMEARA